MSLYVIAGAGPAAAFTSTFGTQPTQADQALAATSARRGRQAPPRPGSNDHDANRHRTRPHGRRRRARHRRPRGVASPRGPDRLRYPARVRRLVGLPRHAGPGWPGRLPAALLLGSATAALAIWGTVVTRGLAPLPRGPAARRLGRAITIATVAQLAASCALPVIVAAADRPDLTVTTVAIMGYVPATAALFALGAWADRDLVGAVGIVAFIAAFACLIGIGPASGRWSGCSCSVSC